MTTHTDVLRGRHILVVEDEYLIAMDLCHCLDREGATVIGPIPTVQDALTLIEGLDHVDAAVLDINLQGEKVFPVVDVLTERHIPFVFTTGYDVLGLPERYRSAPICSKPILVESVVEAVRRRIAVT